MCNDETMSNSYEPPMHRFAPVVLEKQRRSVEHAMSAGLMQHSADELAMVINQARQIVYASPKLIEIFGEGPLGRRPGEMLKCVHAGTEDCGLTELCRYCGAAKAIVDAQRTLHEINGECVVQTKSNGLSVTYNFNIRTIPIEVESERYLVLLLEDMSEKKHQAALERIFFHDILNTASGLSAYLDLLKRQVTTGPNRELVVRAGEITESLIDEIQSQKLLVSAENGTLNPSRQMIIAEELVHTVVAQYEQLDLASKRIVRIAPFSESFSLVSDETILRRVLGNMLKNALEASEPGDTIDVRFGKENGRAIFEVHNPGAIPGEVQPKIFSRFFSTKGPGRGLGTYSIRLLTENYLEGHASFSSGKDEGTTFSVSIPIRDIS